MKVRIFFILLIGIPLAALLLLGLNNFTERSGAYADRVGNELITFKYPGYLKNSYDGLCVKWSLYDGRCFIIFFGAKYSSPDVKYIASSRTPEEYAERTSREGNEKVTFSKMTIGENVFYFFPNIEPPYRTMPLRGTYILFGADSFLSIKVNPYWKDDSYEAKWFASESTIRKILESIHVGPDFKL